MSEQQDFPRAITIVERARAQEWLKSGIALFAAQRKTCMLMMLCLVVCGFISMTLLSEIGVLAYKTLLPFFVAGRMYRGVVLEHEKPLSVLNLFDGFQNQLPQLIRTGLLYTCLHLISVLILAWFFTANAGPLFIESLEKIASVATEGGTPDLATLVPPPPGILIKSAILWLFLSIPSLMLLCFSPLLTRLYSVDTFTSLRLSFTAVWRNRSAFFTLALCLLFLLMVFMLPIMLLMFFLKLMSVTVAPLFLMMVYFIIMLIMRPILIASIYTAHKDIFTIDSAPKKDILMA